MLSGGEIAALVLLDACVRLLPGVMGKGESGNEESFAAGLLEYPHYTRPREWEGRTIPPVLLGGDHAAIARWRRAEAERITQERRPDLLAPSSSRPEPSGPAFGRPRDKLRGEPGPLRRGVSPPGSRSGRFPTRAPSGERSRVRAARAPG